MNENDDADDDDTVKAPSILGRFFGYFPAHPFVTGVVCAFIGFIALSVMLPQEVAVAIQEQPAQEAPQAVQAPSALPEKDVSEMPVTPPKQEVVTKPITPAVPVLADAAILITDVGLSRRVAEAIDTQMPLETSLAISAYASDPQGIAKAFKGSNRDIWVQLAAQSMKVGIDPGPLAMAAGMAAKDNIALLHKQIDSIGAISTGVYLPDDADLTQKPDLWRSVALDAIASGKMVLDGTSATVSTELFVQGSEDRISAYMKANIIIDGATTPAALKKALNNALPKILKMKEAIIVVKRPTVLAIGTIAEWIDTLASQGIRLVPVSKFTGLKP